MDKASQEALKLYASALEIAQQPRTVNSASIDFRRDEMEAHLGLGTLSRKAGRYKEAIERLNRAMEVERSIESSAPNRIWHSRYITQIYTELGNAIVETGDENGAIQNYRDAIAAYDRLLQRAPGCLYLQRDRMDIAESLGRYYAKLSARPGLSAEKRQQLRAEARSSFQKSLTTWQDWTKRKLAMQYASKRETQAATALDSLPME